MISELTRYQVYTKYIHLKRPSGIGKLSTSFPTPLASCWCKKLLVSFIFTLRVISPLPCHACDMEVTLTHC